MLKPLMIFLLTGSLASCITEPSSPDLDLHFAFCEVVPNEQAWACLKVDDVQELKEALIECKSKEKK